MDLVHAPKTEIAKWIRVQLKKEYPECKWSVTTRAPRSIDVYLMEAPFDVFEGENPFRYRDSQGNDIGDYAQLNEYALLDDYNDDERKTNGVTLTPECWQVMKRAAQLLNQHNFDNSDPMTDYFHVNYWTGIGIGKWDRPFVKKDRRGRAPVKTRS